MDDTAIVLLYPAIDIAELLTLSGETSAELDLDIARIRLNSFFLGNTESIAHTWNR